MKQPYYIFSSGKLKRKENTLRFYPYLTPANTPPDLLAGLEDEIEIGEYGQMRVIPVENIESLYLFGETTFNAGFFTFLSQKQIPLHIFNYHGFYSGSWYPREYLNSGFLLVEQTRHYSNAKKRLVLAKKFIEAGSFNILKNLRYYAGRDVDLTAAIETIERYRLGIEESGNIEELMGVEGNIRQTYYSCFPSILKDKFDFQGRVKNPPDNAINTLISFGNAMVYTVCLSEIYRTQLSPLISFLHQPGVRRFSLALDIAEIFKPLFADRVLFKCLNQQMIQEKDFDRQLNYCYLKESGRKAFVKEFEEKMATTLRHRGLQRHVSWRRLIRLECYKLVKHLTGAQQYEGFKAWW